MSDPLFVLGVGSAQARLNLDPSNVLRTEHEICQAYREFPRARWVILDRSVLFQHLRALWEPKETRRRLLTFDRPSTPRRALLETLFRVVVNPDEGGQFLPPDEMLEVMRAENAADLLIGGVVDRDDGALILYRGNLERLVVPLIWFKASPASPSPDPMRFRISDFGQTILLGEYEAAVDAVLYEFDPHARRRMKSRLRERDSSFGGSLKRLRKLKGLRRGDFAPLAEKTIARIERGENKRPQGDTLQVLADRLGVAAGDIDSY